MDSFIILFLDEWSILIVLLKTAEKIIHRQTDTHTNIDRQQGNCFQNVSWAVFPKGAKCV